MTSNMTEYRAKMTRIHQYLGGKCARCGVTKNLHVDHVDHTQKYFTITTNWGRKWSDLEPELKKCQLLCDEHHLEKTIEEGSLSKGWTTQPRQEHGTVNSYTKYKCRCDLCRSAKSEAMKRQYRNKRGVA